MEVVRRARAGDRDALATLWRGHQHLLLRYFRARGAPSPEDLASQVWIDVAAGLDRFEGDDHDFRRWLFTIARRRDVDRVRTAARRPSDLVAAPGADTRDPSADEAFVAGESLDRAIALVRRLPPDQAEAVLLRVVADLDVAQVAAIMGRREGHVRVLVHRGLKRLASELTGGAAATTAGRRSRNAVTPAVLPTMDTAT
jgi:RNA polymerase sigma-70 factor (ECF subfamily)